MAERKDKKSRMQNLSGLHFELNAKEKQKREQMIDRLAHDPDVCRFLEENKLLPLVIERYASRMDTWSRQKKICAQCQGLLFCQSAKKDETHFLKGHFTDLHAEDNSTLTSVITPCRYQLQEMEKIRHRDKFRMYHGSEKDLTITMNSIQANYNNEDGSYKKYFRTAVQTLKKQEKGFIVYGPPGTGKTYMLCALANELAKRNKSISYVRMPLLIAELKSCFKDDDRRREIMSALRFSEILILDDFGSESVSDWSRDEILFPVLDDRMSAHRLTLFASNADMEELDDIYTNGGGSAGKVAALRLMERVRTLADPVKLPGDSRRH
jgi:primosomal protein DnaI